VGVYTPQSDPLFPLPLPLPLLLLLLLLLRLRPKMKKSSILTHEKILSWKFF
jgi:hypothetical protein